MGIWTWCLLTVCFFSNVFAHQDDEADDQDTNLIFILNSSVFRKCILHQKGAENSLKTFLKVADDQKAEYLRLQSNTFLLRVFFDLTQEAVYLRELLEQPNQLIFTRERCWVPLIRQILRERSIGRLPLEF